MTSLEKGSFVNHRLSFIWLIVFNILLVLLWNGRELQIIMGGFSCYNRLDWFLKWWGLTVTSATLSLVIHKKISIMKLQLVPALVLYNSWQKFCSFIFQNLFSRIFLTAVWLSHDQVWVIIEGTASLTWL